MMNQLYEKKCDCRHYDDPNDHRSALLKMELPEYDDHQYGGTSYTIFRAMRFIGYIIVLFLLSYSLWRIHVIESTLMANDRFNNISRIIELENSVHHRVSRSVKDSSQLETNMFTFGEKELGRGTMLTSKNENVPLKKKRPLNKEDFENLVNSLFDKIHIMHNDSDRAHLDHNMREVFQAWFPVFDALLPRELMEDQEVRKTRSADTTSEESSEEKKQRLTRAADKTSEESSEEKKQRLIRSVDKTSEESSEEKKQRFTRAAEDNDEGSSQESSEEQQNKESNKTTKGRKQTSKEQQVKSNDNTLKSSEESSEEKHQTRDKREAHSSESGSSESFEEQKPKWTYYRHESSTERFQENNRRKYPFTRKNNNSDESKSSVSSESAESSEKTKDKVNLSLIYHVITQTPNYVNDSLNEISSNPVTNK